MKKHSKLLILLLIYAFLSNLVFSQDFEVSPARIVFNAEPNEVKETVLTVTNHSPKTYKFQMLISDYNLNIKGDKLINKGTDTIKHSCAKMLLINPQVFELSTEESREVKVSIQVPNDDNSTRWAVIYLMTVKEQTAGEVARENHQAGVMISPRIAIYVTQSPRSNQKYRMKINGLTEITTSKDTSRVFKVYVENIGEKITKFKYWWVLTNLNTEVEISGQHIEKESYPETVTELLLYVPKNATAGTYSLGAILDYGNKKSLEGTQTTIKYP